VSDDAGDDNRMNDDILDAFLAQQIIDEDKGASNEPLRPQRNALFAVNTGALNADKEMKRLFGVRYLLSS
jgi:hypothetical protein